MLDRYAKAAMARAQTKQLDDGTWFAEVPGLTGLWGCGVSREASLADLASAIEDWVTTSLRHGQSLPVLDGVGLTDRDVAQCLHSGRLRVVALFARFVTLASADHIQGSATRRWLAAE